MATLSRVNYFGTQRLDAFMLLADQSFTAFDFRTLVRSFTGNDNSYILNGFKVVGRTGLTVSVEVSDALVYNPQDNNGSFYYSLAGSSNIVVDLPANQTNIFVEARFVLDTTSSTSMGAWDSLQISGDDVGGSEYSLTADLEKFIKLEISVNTAGFSDGAVPLLRASTDASNVLSMQDCRQLLFRLGTGGANPDPAHKFPFSTIRAEAIQTGNGVDDSVTSPFRDSDAIGAINDKAFKSFKDWMDAVMTRIAELSGATLWYSGGSSSMPVTNISLSQLFFDALGHNIEAQKDVSLTFDWPGAGVTRFLASHGADSVSVDGEGLIKWKSNYSTLSWFVGGSFNSSTHRRFTGANNKFSINVADGESVYLRLEREVVKGSGASVKWKDNSSHGAYDVNKTVSGVAGDFTGIAIGDYIRKDSQGYAQYNKVVAFWNGSSSITQAGQVAGANVVALELADTIDSAVSEPLKYFRESYSSNDLVAAETATDADYYWLGRRNGQMFYLKNFGSLQVGEEVSILDGTFSFGNNSLPDLTLEHSDSVFYDSINGYTNGSNSGLLLRLRRFKRDNTLNEGDAFLAYTIDAPISIALGESLWVSLNDDTDGAVTAGSVVPDNSTNAAVANRYEVFASNEPKRVFNTKDVFCIARCVNIGGKDSLLFFDGSMISDSGKFINTGMEVKGSVKIRGGLTVEGPTHYSSVTNWAADDKLITLGVGLVLDTAEGGGFEVVDNTIQASQADVVNGDDFITLTYASPHGYVVSDEIGCVATENLGSLTAEQISGPYTVVASASLAGEAEVISATELKLVVGTVSSLSETETTNPPKTFVTPWSVNISAANGALNNRTSWRFRVKGVATTPTITPVQDYGTVATSHSANMTATRVPFVNDDNQGPSGADSTLNYDAGFTWDNVDKKLTVENLAVTENFAYSVNPAIITSSVSVPLYTVNLVDTSSAIADITITLADDFPIGTLKIIKDIGGQSSVMDKGIILMPSGADTIDGQASVKIEHDYRSLTLVKISAGWAIV